MGWITHVGAENRGIEMAITADIVRLVGRWGIQTEGTRVDNIDLKPLRPTEILA